MPLNADLPSTLVLFNDGSKKHRAHWSAQLKRCSPSYEILEVQTFNQLWTPTDLNPLIV
jgi:hypothetical protein